MPLARGSRRARCGARSAPAVPRFALLAEGRERLEPVLGGEHALVAARLGLQAACERLLAAGVDRGLRGAHRDRAVLGDRARELERRLAQLAGRRDAVDEADALGLGGVELAR